MSELISDGYKSQLLAMSAAKAWGGGGCLHAKHAVKLAHHYDAKSVLDYGCGPGTLKNALARSELLVSEYDPGIAGKQDLPEPADLVVCVDVLEHVEPECVADVIEHIHSVTLKVALLAISLRPAEKRLPDGRNAHLTIDNARWWYEQLYKLDWTVTHLPIKKRPDIGRFIAVKS